jgi:hypothetical protein
VDVVIGVDVGQRADPTAIAVVERQERGEDDHHVVRFLERLPLGTPYPTVAERLEAVVDGVKGKAERRQVETARWTAGGQAVTLYEERDIIPHVTLYVDATGVGQPVVDLLAVAGVRPIACYFTHGDRRVRTGHEVSIGKAWLVSRLQALLQTGRLHLPDTDEARVLARELQDYEIRVDEDANDRYGAFKVGTHDDLVTALGLGVQPGLPRWQSW